MARNITFALLKPDTQWRTDFTTRFIEHANFRLNPGMTAETFLIVESVDEALDKCKTQYLLVQSPGNIIADESFYIDLVSNSIINKDLVFGTVKVEEDYMRLSESCLFINLDVWRTLGKPKFRGNGKEGPRFSIEKSAHDEISAVTKMAGGGSNTFVPPECSEFGADMLVKQLETFGRINCLPGIARKDSYYYLDKKTPYFEIHCESYFERQILSAKLSEIRSLDLDSIDRMKDFNPDIIIAPAIGLKAHTLAEIYQPKKIIVYSENLSALRLQEAIFNIKRPEIYGDIIAEYIKTCPAVFSDNCSAEHYAAVSCLQNVETLYANIDAFGYQMEDLIKSLDPDASVLIDFSDLYIQPFKFYKKPLYQVQGLFHELYSLLKSRTAPTRITGLAPGFQQMDHVKVNTDTVQFDVEAAAKHEEQVKGVRGKFLPNLFFALSKIGERTVDILPSFASAKPQSAKQPIAESAVKPETPVQPVTAAEPTLEMFVEANGWNEQRRSETINKVISECVVYSKKESLQNTEFIFEYVFNPDTKAWIFRAALAGKQKFVEFSNGACKKSLLDHMKVKTKINPRVAIRYL